MNPTCSVIIRAHNEEKYLGRLLDGIRQQTQPDVEIVLVDSGSTDRTLEIASRCPLKLVSILPHEFTFGRSLNRGIAAASGELLVMASAHVYPVYPDWLEKLLQPLVDDPRTGLTYGKQRGAPESNFAEHRIFAHWYPDQPRPRQDHPFCNNANAAIRRSLWEQHPYDETLPGLEDLAWARWAFEQGQAIQYVPEAEVVHVHSETPQGVYNRYRREGMAFKQIYPQEHFRFFDFIKLFLVNFDRDMHEAFRQGKLGKSLRSILWFRWMQFWGTYQGFRHSGPLTWQLKQAFYYPGQPEAGEISPRRDIDPIEYSDT